jgi:hypothetical protein
MPFKNIQRVVYCGNFCRNFICGAFHNNINITQLLTPVAHFKRRKGRRKLDEIGAAINAGV